MNVARILANLRRERELIQRTILILEGLAQPEAKRGGRTRTRMVASKAREIHGRDGARNTIPLSKAG